MPGYRQGMGQRHDGQGHIEHMAIPTDEERLERRITGRLNKAIHDFGLIEEGDRILAGLSGGKDSLCLVDLLSRRRRVSKPAFSVEAIHVRMENVRYESDASYLESFCLERGVPLHTVTTSFDPDGGKCKSPCFPCSWNRRKQFFTKAQELGCNKIALGHHRDDIIHTTMMNLFFHGSFSTMPLRLRLRKMPITMIRPLGMVDEADLARYAALKGYVGQVRLCPHERETFRDAMRETFRRIESMTPEARHAVWRALEREGKLTEG